MPSSRATVRRGLNLLCPLALLALLAWFWSERVLTSTSLITLGKEDLFLYFVPMYTGIAEAIREGRVPLWNPQQGCGTPFLAVLQGGVMYPARLLLLMFDPSTAHEWSTILHVIVAALGMFAFVRALGAGIAGALVASIAFTYNFALSAIYAPASFLEPGVWLPVAGLAVLRIATTRRWRYVGLATWAIAAPILAGGYQIALYSVYGLALVCLGMVVDRAYRRAVLMPSVLVRLTAAGVLALMISSVQWAPTLLWTRDTIRSTKALSAEQINPLPVSPAYLATTLIARRANLTFTIPPPLIALGLVGALAGPTVLRPLAYGGILAFLLSLGPQFPIFSLYYFLPGFSMFRVPARLHYLVLVATSAAAAFGVDALSRAARPAGRVRTVFAAVAVIGGSLAALHAPNTPPALDRYDLLSAAASLSPVLLPPPLAAPATIIPVLASSIGWRQSDAALPYAPGGPELFATYRQTYRRLAAAAGLARVVWVAQPLFSVPFETKKPMLIGAFAPDDYEPMASRRLSNYASLLVDGTPLQGELRIPPVGHLGLTGPPASRRLLDMMSVRYLVAPRLALMSKPSMALLAPYAEALALVEPADRTSVYVAENTAALPRAYSIAGVRPVGDDDEAARRIMEPDFDPWREVVATGSVVASAVRDPLTPARIVSYEPERVVVRANAAIAGALVLTDAYAPGWAATVDGVPTPIWAANYLFRGVAVPAGEHEVIFTYDAPGYRAGRRAAALGILVLVGVPLTVGARRAVHPSG